MTVKQTQMPNQRTRETQHESKAKQIHNAPDQTREKCTKPMKTSSKQSTRSYMPLSKATASYGAFTTTMEPTKNADFKYTRVKWSNKLHKGFNSIKTRVCSNANIKCQPEPKIVKLHTCSADKYEFKHEMNQVTMIARSNPEIGFNSNELEVVSCLKQRQPNKFEQNQTMSKFSIRSEPR